MLLPEAFYEATILARNVENPCRVGENGLCRRYSYPNISSFDVIMGEAGFTSQNDNREPVQEYLENEQQLLELKEQDIPLINSKQQEIHLDLTVTKPGPYVLVINYVTPDDDLRPHIINVQTSTQKDKNQGQATLSACPYTNLCRQVVVDANKKINIFNFDTNFISVILKGEDSANVAIKSIVAIPYEQWSLDYIRPNPVCVRKDGKCVKADFPIAPDSKKVKIEQKDKNETSYKPRPPNMIDNTTVFFLDKNAERIEIPAKVPHGGYYVFVVQYYQPNFPEYDLDVIIHNGKMYEAKLPVKHCPSSSGKHF